MKKKNQREKKPNIKKRGFTLIEILVVSTIIIVISAIGLVSYSGAQVRARDAQRAQDLENMRTTLLLFRSEEGYYPVAQIEAPSRVAVSFSNQVLSLLRNTFRVPEAHAAIVDQDPTPTPVFEEEIIKPTPTPSPTPTSTPAIKITPFPTIDPGTQPQDKIAYEEMTVILVEAGYIESDDLPQDPVNNNQYYYGYDSDGSSFTLTARLENDDSVLTITD